VRRKHQKIAHEFWSLGTRKRMPVWRAIITCFPDATAETKSIIVEGERAAVHMTITGTHQASVMPLLDGLEPTGRPIEWDFLHLFRGAGQLDRRTFGSS
jgi:hypothetical protein